MENKYSVEKRDGGYWVGGTRISLDSVVLAFRQGLSPETIATECFPLLTLAQVYVAIAYYLAHRQEIDDYLQQGDAETEAMRQAMQNAAPELARRFAAARRTGPE
jgi:uncharacterized protein (DUF433 family)